MTTTLDLDFTITTTLDPRITFSRASTGTYFDSAGVMQTAAVNVPRFDYDPVTHVAKGLLLEPSFANSLLNSQDFTNATYTKAGITVTANQAVAPDGTTTADLITVSASPATLTTNFAVSDARTYVMSVFAKKGTSDWFYLCGLIGTPAESPRAYFNLATGAMGSVDAGIVNSGIRDVGNGWYRCWLTRLAPTGGTERWCAGVCDGNGSNAATVGRTVYFWGGQFEDQSIISVLNTLTSYIPTTTGPVTRSADAATMTGTDFSSWYNQLAGTFVVEFTPGSIYQERGVVSADADTLNESIRLYGEGANLKATVTDGSVLQADLTLTTLLNGQPNKAAVSYAANDIAACLNGGSVGVDTVATLPTPTQLRIGAASNVATALFFGHLRRIQFQNTALTDAELVTLTTPGSGGGGEPVPPAIGPTTTGGSAFWDQDYDDREYESSRKRRKRFLDERARRIAELADGDGYAASPMPRLDRGAQASWAQADDDGADAATSESQDAGPASH